jgi:hypothetical protein
MFYLPGFHLLHLVGKMVLRRRDMSHRIRSWHKADRWWESSVGTKSIMWPYWAGCVCVWPVGRVIVQLDNVSGMLLAQTT